MTRVEGGVAHLVNLNTQRTANRRADDLGSPKLPWTREERGL